MKKNNKETTISEILCVVITGGCALVFLLFLFSECDVSCFSSLSNSVCLCFNLIASLGLIYVTHRVGKSVNQLSIETKREDDYTVAILRYRDELQHLYSALLNQDDNRTYDSLIYSKLTDIYYDLLYYTQKHPTLENKDKINEHLENLIKNPKSYLEFENLNKALNQSLQL